MRQRRPGLTPAVEDFPAISIAQLRQAGVLPPGRITFHVIPAGGVLKAVSDKDVIVETSSDGEMLTIWFMDDRPFYQDVSLIEKRVGPVVQTFFICPVTGRAVRTIYRFNEELCSRHAYSLAYNSQIHSTEWRRERRAEKIVAMIRGTADRGPARGDNRRRLAEELTTLFAYGFVTHPADRSLAAALVTSLAQARDEGVESRRLERRARPTNTARRAGGGIHYDSPSYTWAMIGEHLPRLEEEYRKRAICGRCAQDWPGHALPRAVLEDFPAIDIRVLAARKLLVAGDPNCWKLTWAAPGYLNLRVFGAADLRNPSYPFLALRILNKDADGKDEERFQTIGFRGFGPRERPRWRFMDPGSNRSCEVVYLRGPAFAAAKSQHLAHRSQFRPYRA